MRRLCCFCQVELETRDHLFFGCDYAKEIWKQILQLCGLHKEIRSWTDELAWAINRVKGKTLISIVLRMAWKACIYNIWCERNRRLHNGMAETSLQLLDRIKEVLRIRLVGLEKVAEDDINRALCCNWGFTFELIA